MRVEKIHFAFSGISLVEKAVTFEQLTQSSDAGAGTLNYNNATLPNGASMAQRLGGIGSYIQTTISNVTNSEAISISLSIYDDDNYGWNSTNIDNSLINIYHVSGTIYYALTGDFFTPHSVGTVSVNDILRLRRATQDDLVFEQSSNGISFSVLHTFTGLLAYVDYPYIKTINAIQGSSKHLYLVRGLGLKNKTYDFGSINPLFIFTGESNSGGFGVNSDATAGELAVHTTINILNNTTLASFDNLQIGVNNLVGHAGLTDNATHGWELEMANIADLGRISTPIALVKAGQGGTVITNWDVGNTSYLGTNCWQIFQDRVNAALSIHPTYTPIIFYEQAVNDGIAGTDIDLWTTKTIAHFNKIRALSGFSNIKIIMQKIPNTSGTVGYYAAYNAKMDIIASSLSNVYTINPQIADMRDPYHTSYKGNKYVCDKYFLSAFGLTDY